MSVREHLYELSICWTGNTGTGTSDYRSYERSHVIGAEGKPEIEATSDPAFRGDKTKYNPEELLVASPAGCHMLWFLHFCAVNGVIVTDYTDRPTGVMTTEADGNGRFAEVTLHPTVTVTEASMLDKLDDLHRKAHEFCYIANSVNFPVRTEGKGKTA